MASLFNMPRPRGRRNESDNLLGLNGDMGMTDSSFQGMGRAPVDELFAGRNAVLVDDTEFAADEADAKSIRDIEIANKQWAIDKYVKDGVSPEDAELYWAMDAREKIYDNTGMDLYPGDLVRSEKEPQFMREFSDSGAHFRHDGLSRLNDNTANSRFTTLGPAW